MNVLEKMRKQLTDLKAEAQNFLDNDKVKEAEVKTNEVKILNVKIEYQEKLDEANNKLSSYEEEKASKDEEIETFKNENSTLKEEKEEMRNKFNNATETVTELNNQVKTMQPIVDKYNKDQYEEKLNEAKSNYKAKFEKCDSLNVFKLEETQNLILDTANEDKEVSSNAKYSLSEKIIDCLDNQSSSSVSVEDIQEDTKLNKNLNPEQDDFENTYGFKKQ